MNPLNNFNRTHNHKVSILTESLGKVEVTYKVRDEELRSSPELYLLFGDAPSDDPAQNEPAYFQAVLIGEDDTIRRLAYGVTIEEAVEALAVAEAKSRIRADMEHAVKENLYGCTRKTWASDLTGHPALRTQLDEQGIEYREVPLSMGKLFAEAATIVNYRRKNGEPVTVLVVPQVGADCWGEDYFHFPGLAYGDALGMDWAKVYEAIR
jgi:hypothetical protein